MEASSATKHENHNCIDQLKTNKNTAGENKKGKHKQKQNKHKLAINVKIQESAKIADIIKITSQETYWKRKITETIKIHYQQKRKKSFLTISSATARNVIAFFAVASLAKLKPK